MPPGGRPGDVPAQPAPPRGTPLPETRRERRKAGPPGHARPRRDPPGTSSPARCAPPRRHRLCRRAEPARGARGGMGGAEGRREGDVARGDRATSTSPGDPPVPARTQPTSRQAAPPTLAARPMTAMRCLRRRRPRAAVPASERRTPGAQADLHHRSLTPLLREYPDRACCHRRQPRCVPQYRAAQARCDSPQSGCPPAWCLRGQARALQGSGRRLNGPKDAPTRRVSAQNNLYCTLATKTIRAFGVCVGESASSVDARG
eukprot:364728-Chlamydomonas_euryale.AAC.6